MANSLRGSPTMAKYKLSRRGKKLQSSDDQRTLMALPREVPERTWAEILQKEENDLMIFDIREEIIEEALTICYQKYMAKQNTLFAVYCASEAWLKLINWHFFRHDPGEDPSAYPSCYIPKRKESWIPDQFPDPSPKDTWCKHELVVQEEIQEEGLKKWSSSESIERPVIEDIPEEFWFPGKVNLPIELFESSEEVSKTITYEETSSSNVGAESEVLQNVTDYSPQDVSAQDSTFSALKTTTPVNGSLQGAGDSTVDRLKPKRRLTQVDKSKLFSKASVVGRSKALLPPLAGDSRSRISIISDCRLRNLRLDTQYEITSEKIDTPPGEMVKRK